MSRSRLATVLEDGLRLPPGEVLVLRPPAAMDLSALPRERVLIRHGFRPDRDAWAAAGYGVVDAAPEGAAAALACMPRSKALARSLVHQAARAVSESGLVLVDGQRTDGVDALWREVRERVPGTEGLSQGHGRLFWFEGGPGARAAFEDWRDEGPRRGSHGLFAEPGVFSADGPDRGSLLLAEALPPRLPRRLADFGAGIGVLALAALAREGVESIDLVEAEIHALDCARLNVADPRATFRWEDALALPPALEWDGILMNPPFHGTGREADPGIGRAFIAAAARHLAPGGQLWLVANRHLPYEAALADAFREVAAIGGDGGYKLIHATGPKGRGAAPRPAARGRVRRR